MAGNSRWASAEDTASSTASASPPKKVALPKATELKAKPRLRTSEMVIEAVKTLQERGGSSLFAIKKYINLMYKLDTDRQAHLIKKYLKAAVASGELVQTKGKGASGSFKLPSAKAQAAKRKEAKLVEAESAATKVAPAKKAADKRSSKAESAKPSSSTKKLASSKVTKKESSATAKNSKNTKGALAKSPKSKNALPKSPKAKKLTRSPVTKPKAPKPKKVGASVKSPRAA